MTIFTKLCALVNPACIKDVGEDTLDLVLKHATAKNDEDLVRILIDKIKNATQLNEPLALACENGFDNIVAMLVDAGASNVSRALEYAVGSSNVSMVQAIVSKVVDVGDLNAALLQAVRSGTQDIVIALLDGGATDLTQALEIACANGDDGMARTLFTRSTTEINEQLVKACVAGNRQMTEFWMQQGATYYNRGLHGAAANGSVDIARQMLTSGANDLVPALAIACANKQTAIVQLLLEEIDAAQWVERVNECAAAAAVASNGAVKPVVQKERMIHADKMWPV